MLNFASAQSHMRERAIDGWLIYDFRGSNPVLAQLLPGQRSTSRRALLYIPQAGPARLLAHALDAAQFAALPLKCETYLSWTDLRDWLAAAAGGAQRIAMEYAPGGTLPVVSIVDAGAVEFVRSLGLEIASSANLIQVAVAVWSPAARKQHDLASTQVGKIKDEAFALMARCIRDGNPITEYDAQQFIVRRFGEEGLEFDHGPIVAVNAHSGDPHYEPTAANSTPIRANDWIMLDLWARRPGDENVFSDITWMAFAGPKPPPAQQKLFDTVRAARDAVVDHARRAWKAGERIAGWQLDESARRVIIDAGFERGIKHRTGHSLSPGQKVHGLGMNLDNFETHDTREMLPNIGFTIEPGIYLPEFGCRSEINIFVDPAEGPVITSPLQKEVVLLS